EKVDRARARAGVFMRMSENIEDRLAQPVGGRPHEGGGGRFQRAPFETAADHAHPRQPLGLRGPFGPRPPGAPLGLPPGLPPLMLAGLPPAFPPGLPPSPRAASLLRPVRG